MVIHTDRLHRMAYATDASVYREMPYGVACPETEADIRELIRYAREKGISLIPRAGGTSIAGQVVGSGLVADISRHFTKILEINAEEHWAWVQPGVVRDELNLALKPYGLFFSPETSTSNRCCIGGMVGNNGCGTHSLVYGSTRHHLLEARVLLADGSEELLKPCTLSGLEGRFGPRFWEKGEGESGSLAESIYAQMARWATDAQCRQTLTEHFPDPSLQRRSCGYAIDEAIGCGAGTELPADSCIDLCKLFCGSEGTLAFATAFKLHLDPLPPEGQLALCCHCPSLEAAFEANLVALRHHPVAVELMDGKILELGKNHAESRKNRFFVQGDPAALLIAEFNGPDGELSADALEKERAESGLALVCTRVYGADVSRVWALRKAGLGVLSGMKGDAKPVGVIEDTAVAPERLPAYMADFRAMMSRIGLDCVYYGHIGTGELHLRPILNLKTAEGRAKFREVAVETALLVRRHRGSLSGEHGDGRLRGEFIPLLYGEECYRMMCEVKRCWDAGGLFNPGKITGTPPMDEWLRYTVGQRYVMENGKKDKTWFNWRAAFDECKVEGASGVRSQTHALMCSIEQCNGAGDCRRSVRMGGTLCPAFKVSGEELMATRARANVLRECLTYGDGVVSPEVKEVLDSCLACKACRSECPSNVDMTRIRAELLQQMYDRKGTPLRSFAVARMAMVERFGHLVWPLYNFFATWSPSSWLIKKVIRFSTERQIPTLSRRTMRMLVRQELKKAAPVAPKGRVLLFADEFTNFQEAEIGLTFAQLLMRLGYQVEVPRHVESGRAAISKGCLRLAKKFALKNFNLLNGRVTDDCPLVGIEPSCILSFRDEYPDLLPPELRRPAQQLAKNCLLFDEFLVREMAAGRITAASFRTDKLELWLHGHCHQKALVGVEKMTEALRLLQGAELHVIPSGCCGMAGAFGYEKEHYRTSLAIGEMVLFPEVRRAMAEASERGNVTPAVVLAPGTSCRQQIKDGTGVQALHPVELLYRWLN